jgi:hypothetical protein
VPPAVTPAPTPPPLEGLKDVVLPAPVPWWPPAPGWYVVAALLLVAAAWIAWLVVRRHRRNAYRREALREIDALAASSDVAPIPELLRRVALCAAPGARVSVVAPVGDAWLRLLDRMGGDHAFTRGPGRLLPDIAYGSAASIEAIPRAEKTALFAACRRWIARHRWRS